MKLINIILLIIFIKTISFSQNDTAIIEKDSVSMEELNEGLHYKIGIAARSYSDSIIIRWAVSKPAIWKLFKNGGFILERASVLQDGTYGSFKSVKEGIFKPWTDEQWEEYFISRAEIDTTEIDYDNFAYIFGSSEEETDNITLESSGNEIQDIKDRKSKLNWQVLFAVLSANASTGAAEGLGLRYVDKDVKPGEKFVYKISPAFNSPVYIIEPGLIEAKAEPYNPDFAKQILTSAENEGSIGINWKSNNNLMFYNVVRSDDEGKTFHKLTKTPLLTFKSNVVNDSTEGYLDTLIINYKPYVYRVYGSTTFADEVLVGEIKAMGRDRTPPEQPFVPQPDHISDNEIKIKWMMNSNPAKDLKGFYVGHDTSVYGEFKYITNLLPPDSREYIDTNFIRGGNNFYLVEAIDTAGNISQSYPVFTALNDSIPPAKPVWVSGVMDSTGVVALVINPNTEKDLMGYRILRSNSPEHEFSSIIESFGNDSLDYTGITEFKDTVSLETTTPYVYYCITALDNRYNESELSEYIAVKRPDIIAPVTPVILDVTVTDKSVSLLFAPSTSEDISYHIAFRRIMNNEKWDSLATLGSADSIFIDLNLKPNIMYEYALLAVDSSGLKSELSFPVNARPYYTGVLPVVKNLSVLFDEEKSNSILKWDYENLENVNFVIYRVFENNPPQRFATVSQSESRNFIDSKLSHGKGKYTYCIKVFDKLGGESKMSQPVDVYVK